MNYEIEGELEDPNTGDKLPFKAKFRIKDETDDKRNNEHMDGAASPNSTL